MTDSDIEKSADYTPDVRPVVKSGSLSHLVADKLRERAQRMQNEAAVPPIPHIAPAVAPADVPTFEPRAFDQPLGVPGEWHPKTAAKIKVKHKDWGPLYYVPRRKLFNPKQEALAQAQVRIGDAGMPTVYGVYTAPDARKRGLMKQLLKKIIEDYPDVALRPGPYDRVSDHHSTDYGGHPLTEPEGKEWVERRRKLLKLYRDAGFRRVKKDQPDIAPLHGDNLDPKDFPLMVHGEIPGLKAASVIQSWNDKYVKQAEDAPAGVLPAELVAYIMKHEGLLPGQTPFRITNPAMRKWKTIHGFPVQTDMSSVPKDRQNFLWLKNPADVHHAIRQQFMNYSTRPTDYGLKEKPTLEAALKVFDQTGATGKMDYLKKKIPAFDSKALLSSVFKPPAPAVQIAKR
jgi:GNAT superfamily N-acetyltransferase